MGCICTLLYALSPSSLALIILFFSSIFKGQLVVGLIVIKVWRVWGGSRHGDPHKASESFIFFLIPCSLGLCYSRLAKGLQLDPGAPHVHSCYEFGSLECMCTPLFALNP
jgi:hypothetical protein